MKKKILAVAAAFLLAPMMAGLAQADGGYMIGKAGVYIPDDSEVDTGFNGEIGYGFDLLPGPGLLAFEGSVGYFNAEQSEDYYYNSGSPNYYGFQDRYEMEAQADVVPLSVSLKAGLESGPFTFYVGGGVDLFFVSMEVKYHNSYRDDYYYYDRHGYSDDDNDVIFGGHVMAGTTFDINDRMFVGLEAKYLATDDMDMSFYGGQDVITGDLNGVTVSGVFGFRF
ncbi:MAG: hypothetical protein LBU39_06895 [Desulfobulbaceae bacterium]|jgi:opacity protein-like surface antigen|nr:hypothetical protein [Desulfobulbaceae bacterium]